MTASSSVRMTTDVLQDTETENAELMSQEEQMEQQQKPNDKMQKKH